MLESTSTKYLSNFVSTQGGIRVTVEERRNKGWGKVAEIMSILSEVDMGMHRLEVGLLLRTAILTNSLLYCAEAWSNVSEKEMFRLEQVDIALMKSLVNGHSKCPHIFYYLETGTLVTSSTDNKLINVPSSYTV